MLVVSAFAIFSEAVALDVLTSGHGTHEDRNRVSYGLIVLTGYLVITVVIKPLDDLPAKRRSRDRKIMASLGGLAMVAGVLWVQLS